MTAKDELMFKTPDALMNGQATVEVIKSCIPAIKNPWAMPSIDVDACLIAIRIATYGQEMDISADCPECSEENDYSFDLVNYLTHLNAFVYEAELTVGDLLIKIRPYNYQEVTRTNIKAMEQQNIFEIVNNDELDDEEKLSRFGASFVKLSELTVDVISGCIVSITTPEGTVEDHSMIENFIANAPADVFHAINDHVSKMKNDIELKAQGVICSECNHQFDVNITMDQSNFFDVRS
jgi:hypothetical protein